MNNQMKRFRQKWAIVIPTIIAIILAGWIVNFFLNLERITPASDSNFHWPYYLYQPAGINDYRKDGRTIHLLVIPNNSLLPSDNANTPDRWALINAFVGRLMFADLNAVILVPAFPRPAAQEKLYTHALDRETLMTDIPELARLDLQLIAMIDDATTRLTQQGWKVDPKVLMMGFSASGMFVNRFALLHPERVRAAIVGSPGGWPIVPVSIWEGRYLRYPIGISDLALLTGSGFDLASFKTVPLMFFLGDQDTNDSVPHADSYDEEDRELIIDLFGYSPVERWPLARAIYNSVGANADFQVYPGTGHTITLKEITTMRNFIKQVLDE